MILGMMSRRLVAPANAKDLAIVAWTGDGTNGRAIAGPDMSSGGVVIFFSFAGNARGFAFSDDGVTVRFGPGSFTGVRTGVQMTSTGITVSNIGGEPSFNQLGEQYLAVIASNDPDICSIIPYTGNATNRTIAHGLSARPDFVTAINTSITTQNAVLHNFSDATMQVFWTTAINQTVATLWNSTSPDSTNVTIGSNTGVSSLNTSGNSYYLISINQNVCRQIAYTGTGANPGPSVSGYGFTPDLVYIANTRVGDSSSKRVVSSVLTPGYVGNESEFDFGNSVLISAERIEAISGGFRIITTDLGWNRSGRTFFGLGFRPKP